MQSGNKTLELAHESYGDDKPHKGKVASPNPKLASGVQASEQAQGLTS